MLDKLEKTLDLIAALKAAIPFEVELTPPLIAHLCAERVAAAGLFRAPNARDGLGTRRRGPATPRTPRAPRAWRARFE